MKKTALQELIEYEKQLNDSNSILTEYAILQFVMKKAT
jgi:hypothetical protein